VGWLTADVPLGADERVIWQKKAGLSLPTAAVRGTLHVTSERLIHVPSRLTRKRHREVRDWPLQRVKSVTGAYSRERTYYKDVIPHGGSLRKRLHVRLDDGTMLLFLVDERDEAVRSLHQIITTNEPASGVRE
jgi:hypothetical protein